MSRNAAYGLAALAVALGAYIFFFEQHTLSTSETDSRRGQLLERFVRDRVSRIEIERGDVRLVLEREPAEEEMLGSWRMVEPVESGTDADAVDSLIGALEWASARQTLHDVTEADRTTFGLDSPRARVVFTVAAERVSILVGRQAPTEDGAYVALDDPTVAYVVGADFFEAVDHDPAHFRDRRLFARLAPRNATRLRVEGEGPARRLEQRDGRWWLTAPLEGYADEVTVDAALEALADLRATRFVDEAPGDLAPFGLDAPALTLAGRVDRGDEPAADFELRVGTACGDHEGEVHARLDEGPVVCLEQDDLDPLRRPPAELRQRRLTTARAAEVERASLEAGGVRVALDREDGRFRFHVGDRDGDADDEAVDEWLSALRDVEAAELVPVAEAEGLDPPRATVTLEREEGPDEVVLLGASFEGGAWARRGEEPVALRLSADPSALFEAAAVRFRSRRLIEEPDERARRFVITRDGEGREVVERDGDEWRVSAPIEVEADRVDVRELLRRAAMLVAARWVSVSPRPEHGLSRPRLTVEALYEGARGVDREGAEGEGDATPTEHVLRIGAETPEGDGAFAQLGEAPEVFVVEAALVRVLSSPLASRAVLSTEVDDVAAVAVEGGEARVEIRRGADGFEAADGAAADRERTRVLLDQLAALRASSATAYGARFDVTHRVVVERTEAAAEPRRYAIELGAAVGEGADARVPARRDDLDVGYLLAPSVVGTFLDYAP